MELSARAVTQDLGGREVLTNLTLDLVPGKITAICGPNGAGKSTLLRVLAGLLVPPLGGAFLDGEPLQLIAARVRARHIGFLPQLGEVAWDITARDCVALGRTPHRDERSASGREAITRALELCDLPALADRRIRTLSGGERARVLMARVLAGQPDWLLADEPMAALDLNHQLALLRVLRKAAQNGCGIVLVMHDLNLAMNHADRVVVLDRGRLIADGPPQDALSQQTISDVWGTDIQWLGESGRRALSVL